MIAEKRLKEDMMREITLDEVYKTWIDYRILCIDTGLKPWVFGEYCEHLKKEYKLRII